VRGAAYNREPACQERPCYRTQEVAHGGPAQWWMYGRAPKCLEKPVQRDPSRGGDRKHLTSLPSET